jgi:hypothetical protein
LAPSSSSSGASKRQRVGLIRLADHAALGGLALGLVLYVMPLWTEGRLRWAFWLTLTSTVLHVFTSHARAGAGRASKESDHP